MAPLYFPKLIRINDELMLRIKCLWLMPNLMQILSIFLKLQAVKQSGPGFLAYPVWYMQGIGNSFRYLCAKNYRHRTWLDKVIEKIKRVQFCPKGYLCTYPLTQNYQIRRVNAYGRGLVFKWSATPLPQGGGVPEVPNSGGSLLFMRTPFVAKLPNLTW